MSADKPEKVMFNWFNPNGDQAGQLVLDASINENHGVQAEISSHQVEKGSNVADNIRPLPVKLTIEGFVTNWPIGKPETYNDGIKGSVKTIKRQIGNLQLSFSAFTFDSGFDRVREIYGDLVDAIQGALLFDVTTTLKAYENLACINFVVPRNAQVGDAIRFTADFQAIRFVDTQTAEPLPPKAQKKNRGAKPGKPLDDKKDAQEKSFEAAALDKLTGK